MTSQWISSGLEWDWWVFFVFVQSLLGFPAADTVTCVIYNTPTWNMSRVADEIQCWLIPSGVHEAKQSELCTWKGWLRTEDENRSFPERILVLSRSQKVKGSIRNYMKGTGKTMMVPQYKCRICTYIEGYVQSWGSESWKGLRVCNQGWGEVWNGCCACGV